MATAPGEQEQLGQLGQQEHMASREYAVSRDARDQLRHLRRQFLIPSRAQLRAKTLLPPSAPAAVPGDFTDSRDIESHDDESSPSSASIYLCGNSLGLQPKLTSERIQQYLTTWATQGVFGHFKPLEQSPLPTWLHADAKASDAMAPIVGARPSEVAVMETLTANLHFLMCAFYKPDVNGRHKIILEGKAFPSDHYAVESQIHHHGLSPSTSMITIEPPSPTESTLPTSHILSVIKEHGSTTSILLLPGIQFYTGQLLDIPTITKAAQDEGIFVIWDLAHAVGNVELQLHEWGVDAAAWCSYKYLNAGPGSIGGLFVHEKNSRVTSSTSPSSSTRSTQPSAQPSTQPESQVAPSSSSPPGPPGYVNRLSGWWGSSKESRFAMTNAFVPIPGAAGFQLSNPSILDITSLTASLEMFALAGGMGALRKKSVVLTRYLEILLTDSTSTNSITNSTTSTSTSTTSTTAAATSSFKKSFTIITPSSETDRGAQLSLKLAPGLLDVVMRELEANGVVVDERQPDVIRVAPAPLYNSFEDVWEFVRVFEGAVGVALRERDGERN